MPDRAQTLRAEVRGHDRRDVVLAAALEAFVRHGYRRTSMEDVAEAARISRPGLYFLFGSKQQLFAEAVTAALEQDLRTAARALQDQSRPLDERLLAAFDAWTGRYLGAVGGELHAVAEAHRDLLPTAALDAPRRFEVLVTDAVIAAVTDAVIDAGPSQDRATSVAIARTLLSVAVGLKHQHSSPETFRQDLRTAIALLLR